VSDIITEDQAFSIVQGFKSMSPSEKDSAKGELRRFATATRVIGAPLFPQLQERRRKAVLALESRFLDDDETFLETVPEENREGARHILSNLSQESRRRVANTEFLQAVTGKRGGYAALRESVGRSLLNIEGEITDSNFHNEVKIFMGKRMVRREMIEGIPEIAARASLLSGDAAKEFSKWQSEAKSNFGYDPKEDDLYRGVFEEAFKVGNSVLEGKRDLVRETVDELDKLFSNTDDGGPSDAISIADKVAAISKEDEPIFLAAVQAFANQQSLTSKEEKKSVVTQSGESFSRSFDNLLAGPTLAIARIDEKLAEILGDPETISDSKETRRVWELRQTLRAIGEGSIDPIRKILKGGPRGLLESAAYGVSGSLPYTAVAAAPYLGIPTIVAATGESNFAQLKLENPDVDESALLNLSYASAVPEALLERIQANIIFGRLPKLGGALKRGAQASSRGLGLRNSDALLAIGAEFTTESAQSLVLPVVQEIATALSQDIPDVDWEKEKEQWVKSLPETLATVIPLSLVGVGAANIREINGGSLIIRDIKSLRAAGLSESQAKEVSISNNPQDKLRDLWGERLGSEKERIEASSQIRKDSVEISNSSRALEDLGVFPKITKKNGEDGYIVDIGDGETIETQTYAEASSARDSVFDANELAQDESVIEMVKFFEEKAAKGESFEISQDFKTLEDQISEGIVDEAQAFERVKLLEKSQGQELGSTDLSSIAVLGSNVTEFKDGVFQSTSKIFRGASVLTVIEEKAEGDAKRWRAEGRVSTEDLSGLIKKYEEATGDRILESETEQAVIEAWSDLVSGYAVARYRDNAQPFQGFRGALKNLLRGYRTFFEQVFRRAAKINKARRDGSLDSDLEGLLSESIGISQEQQVVRDSSVEIERIFGVSEFLRDASFSIAPADFFEKVGKTLDKKLRSPDERIKAFEKAKSNLPAVKLVNKNKDSQRRAFASLRAIVSAFPPEVRSKIGIPVGLLDFKTDKGRIGEINRQVDRVDRIFDEFLRKEYLDDVLKIIKKAQPKKTESRNLKGKLGQKEQANAILAKDVIGISASEVDSILDDIAAKLDKQEEGSIESINLIDKYDLINTVGALSSRDSEHIKYARDWLDSKFGKARQRRKILEEARASELNIKSSELQEATGKKGADQNDAKRDGKLKWFGNFLTVQQLDFPQFLERTFPGSNSAISDGERAQNLIGKYEQSMIDHRKGFVSAVSDIFKIKGERAAMNKMAEFMTPENNTGIFYYKGGQKKESIPIDKVEGIISPFTDDAKTLGFNKSEVEIIRSAWSDHQKKIASRINKDGSQAIDTTKSLSVDFNTTRKIEEQSMSKMEALMDWLFIDQPGNQENQAARGFPEESKEQIEKFIGDDLIKVGEYMKGVLGKMQPEISKVHANINGIGLPNLPNYFPNVMDVSSNGEANLLDPFNPNYGIGSKNPGALKSRIKNGARPKRVSAMHVFFGHVQQMEHYKTFSEFTRDMKAAYGRVETRHAVEAKFGSNHADLLSRWITIIENGGVLNLEAAIEDARYLRWIHKNLAGGILAFRASSLMVQWTNVLSTLQEVPLKSWAKAAIRLSVNPSKMKSAISRAWNSDIITRRREQGGSPELRTVLSARPQKTGLSSKFVQAGLELLNTTDAGFLSISGAIAYEANLSAAKKQGLSDPEAVRFAEEETERNLQKTAQPTDFINKGLAENSASAPIRLFAYMFISDPRRKYANAQQALVNAINGVDREKALRVIPLLILVLPTMEWATRALASMIFKGEDEEEAFDPKELAASLMTNQLNGIPIAGHMVQAVSRSAMGLINFGDNPIQAPLKGLSGTINNSIDGLEAAREGDMEEAVEEFSRALRDAGKFYAPLGALSNIVTQSFGVSKFLDEDQE